MKYRLSAEESEGAEIALEQFIESGALATNMCPNFLRDAYFKAGYNYACATNEEYDRLKEQLMIAEDALNHLSAVNNNNYTSTIVREATTRIWNLRKKI